jgi:hypothetical protein
MSTLQDVLVEWQNNASFRESFKKNPELALRKAGLKLNEEDLEKIKAVLSLDQFGNEKLDERINK